ncbi:MAG TPA: D-2-hydroxyacid dehydrogenase [Anaeromyxobacteraceae bacterium]|nr:D-2-hydroxyacid dehydrogenase [Anaeromyxobacteraceae bacterium]
MPLTLLVLAPAAAPWLPLLERSGEDIDLLAADDPHRIRQLAPRADVIVNGASDSSLLDSALPGAKRARWIHSMWTGVERQLSPLLATSALPFTNARGVFARPLGEWAVGAMLFFSYDLRRVVRQQEASVWQPFEAQELHGKTLGIVGYGGIGRAAAERARCFGVRILGLRRRPELSQGDPLLDATYALAQLDELMAASDFVLVAAPLTATTRGLIGRGQIAAMKPSGVLINVGRGPVVDEAALLGALEAGRIRGAALDVVDVEPLPKGHPFYRLRNVLLSPHTADRVAGFFELPVACFLENLRRFRAGEPLLNVVDKEAGY